MRFAPGFAVVLPALALDACVSPPHGPEDTSIHQDRLVATLTSLPTKRAVLGDVEHQRGLIATEDLITSRLRALGYTPTAEPLSWNLKKQMDADAQTGTAGNPRLAGASEELAAHVWHNIVVDIPGRDLPGEVIILGAHFDAVPGSPGADDDGTGTAALLEIARALKGRSYRRTIRLIYFNLEEIGLNGSAEYVHAHRAEFKNGHEKLIGMVSLEMLGYFADAPNSQRSPIPKIEGVFDPPTVGDFIGLGTVQAFAPFCRRFDQELRAAAPGLKTVVADFLPIAPPDFLRSDHAPFMRAGLPAVMLTDTSNFRNPNYHRPTDTIQTIDAARYTLVVQGVAGAAAAIADGP